MSTHLKRHFKSPFPAHNVHRRDEPIATDTVYSNTPAVTNVATYAQFFVAWNLTLLDVRFYVTPTKMGSVYELAYRRWWMQ